MSSGPAAAAAAATPNLKKPSIKNEKKEQGRLLLEVALLCGKHGAFFCEACPDNGKCSHFKNWNVAKTFEYTTAKCENCGSSFNGFLTVFLGSAKVMAHPRIRLMLNEMLGVTCRCVPMLSEKKLPIIRWSWLADHTSTIEEIAASFDEIEGKAFGGSVRQMLEP
jgi:hypothetical protein